MPLEKGMRAQKNTQSDDGESLISRVKINQKIAQCHQYIDFKTKK